MEKDKEREERIQNEIIVDCYGDYEIKASWHTHMEDNLHFPFKADILLKKRSGEQVVQRVDVLGLASSEDFGNDMMVEVAYTEDLFLLPLSGLKKVRADEETKQAIEDWQYWKR